MPPLVAPLLDAGALARLEQPVLAGDGFVLRPWRAGDAAVVAGAYADPGIQQWHARSLSRTEAAAWVAQWPRRWRDESGAGWAVADDRDDTVLGQLSLRRIDLAEGLAEISYWVLPAARGRQLAARALTVLGGWGFGVLGLHRIEVLHSTRNVASCRVAERAGYPAEGTKRSEARHADGWHDMHLHARIAGDPKPPAPAG
ncbi:GNAT family N-acetyltransferase [Actinoplanes nipponensis]|uniref:GNAT family N-acetyltransferase n=1 Tax=Actinoplanes nipponensis TaxID=135950 RepID=UPI001941278D|nr:GNAT family N-acetyltransferase [Actinoplanes nipponensis]